MSATAVNGVEPIIFLDDVHVTFRTRTGSILHPNLVHAVQGVTIKLMPGQTIGIVGESGCGKSTTANVMCGLQAPTSGKVYFKGKDVTKRTAEDRRHMGRVISVVFQNPATALNPRMVVREQLLDPMRVHNLGTEAEQEKRVKELLELTGLPSSAAEVLPGQLSGGQRRRLSLLLTILDEPNVLILDEPGNDLDTDMLAIVEDLLDGWPGTLILVTHDRFLMERVTDQQWALLDGHLTHMPGGVDQYLRLCNATAEGEPVGAPSAKTGTFDTGAAAAAAEKPKSSGQPNGLSNAERQKLRREVSSLERKMETQRARVEEAEAAMAQVDPTNYTALGEQQAKIDEAHAAMDELEMAWLEASEKLEGEE